MTPIIVLSPSFSLSDREGIKIKAGGLNSARFLGKMCKMVAALFGFVDRDHSVFVAFTVSPLFLKRRLPSRINLLLFTNSLNTSRNSSAYATTRRRIFVPSPISSDPSSYRQMESSHNVERQATD